MPLSRVPSSFTGTTSISSPSANTIRFTTASTTRGQFDSVGNFTLGTFTPPQSTVVRNWVNGDYTRVGQSGAYNLNLYYSTSNSRWEYAATGHGATFVDSGSGNFSIQTTSSSGSFGENASTIAQRIIFGSDGLVTLPSGQLKFPASQNASSDANTLDDYEEGTWTPTISIEGGSGALSATAIYDARYTKIGRLVHVICDVAWSNYYANGGTGAILFGGLPFAYAKGGTQGEGLLMQGGFWSSSNRTGSVFSSELILQTFFNSAGSTGGYVKYKSSSTTRGDYMAVGGNPLGSGSGSLVFQYQFTYVAAT